MAKFEITAPGKGYNGKVGTVTFVDGKATADDSTDFKALSYLRNTAGYEVKKAGAKSAKTKTDKGDDGKGDGDKTPPGDKPKD